MMDDKDIQQLDWEKFYSETPSSNIPWESGKPDEQLMELVASGVIMKGAKILDVGCGLGTQSVYLSKNGFDVTGIDTSKTAIKKARDLAEISKVKANFIVGDVTDMPFEDGQFDFVYDRGCLHHLKPKERSLYAFEIRRVLSPKGFLSLLVFVDVIPPQEGERLLLPYFKILNAVQVILRFPGGGERLLINALLQKLPQKRTKIVN